MRILQRGFYTAALGVLGHMSARPDGPCGSHAPRDAWRGSGSRRNRREGPLPAHFGCSALNPRQALNYDLLAKRWVPYDYIYPFAEGLAGVLMVAGALTWLSVPIALLIGTVGAVSVFKAVYIDRRELKCACVGESSDVPLGFISLTENLMMAAMAVWMALAALGMPAGLSHAM